MSKKKCALVIGHKASSPGAVNENSGVSEFEFNEDLSIRIENHYNDNPDLYKNVEIVRVYRKTNYENLPHEINELDPDFIVSLHCNAYDEPEGIPEATGTEVLYYHTSEKGKKIAQILQRHLIDALGLKDRGIKPKNSEARGGYLLKTTKAPCVIAEPFFIDNDSDFEKAKANIVYLAGEYASAIEEISEKL